MVANSVSEIRGILFTPIRYTADVCYAAGPFEGQSFFVQQEWTPPSSNRFFMSTHRNCAFFPADYDGSRHSGAFVYPSHRSPLWVEYQHWLTKRALIVDQKGFQWRNVRIHIYLLTPWSRVLLEKLASLQLVKKFPAFYGTPRFLTALTSARHLSLS